MITPWRQPGAGTVTVCTVSSYEASSQFWYVLMCIAFGGGYWAKIPVKKALSEMGYPSA